MKNNIHINGFSIIMDKELQNHNRALEGLRQITKVGMRDSCLKKWVPYKVQVLYNNIVIIYK